MLQMYWSSKHIDEIKQSSDCRWDCRKGWLKKKSIIAIEITNADKNN
jgi:hypothetical protein